MLRRTPISHHNPEKGPVFMTSNQPVQQGPPRYSTPPPPQYGPATWNAPWPPTAKPRKTYTSESVLFDVFGGLLVLLGLAMMISTASMFVLVFGASMFVGGVTLIAGAHVITGLRKM